MHKKYNKSESLRKRHLSTEWADLENHDKSWDTRTSIMASFIRADTSIIEFGAGRRSIVNMLPDGCIYQDSDIVSRGENTLVFDLNKELPPISRYDYALFGGVLEYLDNISETITWVTNHAPNIIFSYAVTDFNPDPVRRRERGWTNDWSKSDFLNLANNLKYTLIAQANWKEQIVFYLSRSPQDFSSSP